MPEDTQSNSRPAWRFRTESDVDEQVPATEVTLPTTSSFPGCEQTHNPERR